MAAVALMSNILLKGGMQRSGRDLLIFRKRIEVTSLDSHRRFCIQWADIYNTEEYPLPNWKITTKLGYSLRATEDQLLLTIINKKLTWSPIHQFKIDDPVMVFDWTLKPKLIKTIEIVPLGYKDGGIGVHTYNTNNFVANNIITSSRWPHYSKLFIPKI